MKLLRAALLVTLVSVNYINCESLFSYDGCKVYEVKVRNSEDASRLKSFDGFDGFDFWSMTRLVGSTATVMVDPKRQEIFEKSMNELDIEYKVIIADLEKNFAIERQLQSSKSKQSRKVGFTDFHRHDEINDYLKDLARTYKSTVKVFDAGKSFEGRQINAIGITNGINNVNKSVIFVDAGIHAREWIAPAMALYIINQLVESPNKSLLDHYDWVILPVVNPDGYEYTHTRQRLWRKTRSNSTNSCVGTDGNRNFDYHWGEVGASSNACSETFRGSEPFSEPETQVVRNILHTLEWRCKLYLTFHSYGNYILYPWGWTSNLPDTWEDLDEVAQVAARAIKNATGSKYTVGSSTNVLYAAAGGSDDYAFGAANVPFAYTVELPGGGRNGFDPPASKIKEIVAETWIGVEAMVNAIADKSLKQMKKKP